MLGSAYTPDQEVGRIVFIGCYRVREANTRGWQAGRIGEVQVRGRADQIGTLASQHAHGFGEEDVVASCQANAPGGYVKDRQAAIAGAGPEPVASRQVQLAISAIDAFGINKQDGVIKEWRTIGRFAA